MRKISIKKLVFIIVILIVLIGSIAVTLKERSDETLRIDDSNLGDQSKVYKDTDFDFLKYGMDIKEVVKKVGNPQKISGSGVILFIYYIEKTDNILYIWWYIFFKAI